MSSFNSAAATRVSAPAAALLLLSACSCGGRAPPDAAQPAGDAASITPCTPIPESELTRYLCLDPGSSCGLEDPEYIVRKEWFVPERIVEEPGGARLDGLLIYDPFMPAEFPIDATYFRAARVSYRLLLDERGPVTVLDRAEAYPVLDAFDRLREMGRESLAGQPPSCTSFGDWDVWLTANESGFSHGELGTGLAIHFVGLLVHRRTGELRALDLQFMPFLCREQEPPLNCTTALSWQESWVMYAPPVGRFAEPDSHSFGAPECTLQTACALVFDRELADCQVRAGGLNCDELAFLDEACFVSSADELPPMPLGLCAGTYEEATCSNRCP